MRVVFLLGVSRLLAHQQALLPLKIVRGIDSYYYLLEPSQIQVGKEQKGYRLDGRDSESSSGHHKRH